jgi:hypothetical protein
MESEEPKLPAVRSIAWLGLWVPRMTGWKLEKSDERLWWLCGRRVNVPADVVIEDTVENIGLATRPQRLRQRHVFRRRTLMARAKEVKRSNVRVQEAIFWIEPAWELHGVVHTKSVMRTIWPRLRSEVMILATVAVRGSASVWHVRE